MAGRPPDHPGFRAFIAREQAALRGDPNVARRRARPTLAPADDIAPALKALSDHLHAHGVPPGLLHLGGGSVLAAAWNHRKSTDIDLWISPDHASRLTELAPDAGRWQALFEPPGHQVSVERATREHAAIALNLDSVPVSVFTSHHANRHHPNRQMMRGTVFAAATTEEILRGKLLGRWADEAADAIPIRDLYDVVVARAVEPQALRTALAGMHALTRAEVATRLRALHDDWYLLDPKPVIEPTFNVDLRGLGPRLAPPIKAGDLKRIPVTERTGLVEPLPER